jgi:hypothetical protein
MLDFRDHLQYVTTYVRLIAKVLTKRNVSPTRKTLVIDQILKPKYHATFLGIFIDKQLETIDIILNKAARNAFGPIPTFLTEATHRPTKEMGLGYAPLRDRSTLTGIEHITEVLNKHTERELIAFAHATRVASVFQHWPKEAHEANQAEFPILRILSYIQISREQN